MSQKNERPFKEKFTFDQREKEAKEIIKKYPDRVPVIVEQAKNSTIAKIDKHKFLVPLGITAGQFVYVIRKRIKLQPEKALYIFVNNTLPPTAELIHSIYKRHKDQDQFLYVTYSDESTFGAN